MFTSRNQTHRFSILICFLQYFFMQALPAQEITYNQHIAPIISTHCISCHKPNGVAPFTLLNYADVSSRAKFIGFVTKTKYMPPFKADNSFQHYKNENILSPEEIQTIQDWVTSGTNEGKRFSKKQKLSILDTHVNKIYNSGIPPQEVDISVGMNKKFNITELGKEEFRFFHIPLNNKEPHYIKSIQFIPGNKKLVHHSRIMIDTTGEIAGIDGLSETDTNIYKYQTKPLADPFLFGWVPGNNQISFPDGTGKLLYPKSDFILNMHYSPSPIETSDSSSIRIQFTDNPVEREVITLTMKEDDISNLPFIIKANSTPTFYMRSAIIQEDISLISIMPHMHLLGKSFKSFAVTPAGDLIPLIHIPDWDFNWQMTYTFQRYTLVPKGSVIYAEAKYDNTTANERNPNRIPKDVGYGWGTKDEMMNLVIYYVKYKQGDENTVL
jgi:mono/diheme cytochrome c family protein